MRPKSVRSASKRLGNSQKKPKLSKFTETESTSSELENLSDASEISNTNYEVGKKAVGGGGVLSAARGERAGSAQRTAYSSAKRSGAVGHTPNSHHAPSTSQPFNLQRLVRPLLYFTIGVLSISICHEIAKLVGTANTRHNNPSKTGDVSGGGRQQEEDSPHKPDAGGDSAAVPPPPPRRRPPPTAPAQPPAMQVINQYSREELLSSVLPVKDITMIPSVFQSFKDLLRMDLVAAIPPASNNNNGGGDAATLARQKQRRRAAQKRLSEEYPAAHLPIAPWVQVTDPKMVAARGAKLADYYACYGTNDTLPRWPKGSNDAGGGGDADLSNPLISGFDFAFFPVGCFGDPVPKSADPSATGGPVDCSKSRSPSCKLGPIMSKMAACAGKVFGAFLGDNFYPNGIEKHNDRRIEEEIPEKFTKYPLLGRPRSAPAASQNAAEAAASDEARVRKFLTEDDGTAVRWYATVGNHDVKPRYQFRLENPHWIMPDVRHVSPLMTSPFAPTTSTSEANGAEGTSSSSKDSSSKATTVQLFLFSTQWGYERNDPNMEAEAKWLDEQLTASTADWKIVGTHEQMFGFMGFEHGAGMVEHIHPILIKHNVRLFVCAHQHSVQSFLTHGNYFHVTSAGFAEGSIHTAAKPRRPPGYYHGAGGAVAVLLNKDYGHLVAFDENEHIIFSHRIYRKVGDGIRGGEAEEDKGGGKSVEEDKLSRRQKELRAFGVSARDPMWRPNTVRKCDRFKLKDSFRNATEWDKSDTTCWMYH